MRIFPPRIRKTAAAFAPGASQRRFFPFARTNTAVARSPFTVIDTILPAQGSSRCQSAMSAAVSSRSAAPPCTNVAGREKSRAAPALS